MRFKEAQADPGRNSQGFSMFSRARQKRPRITRLGASRAPKSYLCIRAVGGGGKRAETRKFGWKNEETPRGHPRRFQSGKPPAIKSPRRTCGPGREVSF